MNWDTAIADYDRDLRRPRRRPSGRGAPTRSISPGSPSGSRAAGLAPGDVRHRDVRRYAAGLSSEGAAPATVARKLAAVRGLYDFLVRTERVGQNPAELVSSPKRSEKLPKRALDRSRCARCWSGSRRARRCELRDRAMLELAYSCGLRCEEIVNLDHGALDFESEQLRVLGKGSKERLLPVGEPAQRALRPLPGARPPGAGDAILASRPSSSPRAAAASPTPTSPAGSALWTQGGGDRRRRLAARASPFIRNPSARGRRRSAYHPGVARPLLDLDHAGLHPGRRRPPARHLLRQPPAGMNPSEPSERT